MAGLLLRDKGFEVGQYSLQVCQTIVAHHPEISFVRVISHKVRVNWRQANSDSKEKMLHLSVGFNHATPLQNHWHTREEFGRLTLESLRKLDSHCVWSVSSGVRCRDGACRHIPMMNFHLDADITEVDMRRAIEYICIGQKGALLESGRYYHYYGDFLLDQHGWYKFLGEFLMPCVLVSPRYIGHSLNDGYCSLRLTADPVYKPKIPTVIRVFN